MGTQMGVFCITFTGKSIITVTKWVNVNISATKSIPSTNCPLHVREAANARRLFLFLCPAHAMVKTSGHTRPNRSQSFMPRWWFNLRQQFLGSRHPVCGCYFVQQWKLGSA